MSLILMRLGPWRPMANSLGYISRNGVRYYHFQNPSTFRPWWVMEVYNAHCG